MKQVKIITIINLTNYGNRLQNYAVQTILERYDLQVETIKYGATAQSWKQKLKYLFHQLTGFHFSKRKSTWQIQFKRHATFDAFNQKYIPLRHIKQLEDIGETDYYAVGSDQVWNPKWIDTYPFKKDLFFLTFTQPNKKICMMPSFGVTSIPAEWQDFYRQHLSTIPYLSVREPSGAKLIKEETGREAEVLIDPTLMLDADDWLKIAEQPKKIDCEKDYVLMLFLGSISSERKEYVERIALEQNCAIYDLNDENKLELLAASPSEFLYLIKHAKLVLTDSFHACVFSFIFDRPFQVFAREGSEDYMFSRIENLLSLFSLERKNYANRENNDLLEHDYAIGKQRLIIEREKVHKFLRKSLGLEKNN